MELSGKWKKRNKLVERRCRESDKICLLDRKKISGILCSITVSYTHLYLADAHDDRLQMEAFHGTHTYEEAVEAVCRQIDNACLIPYLMLKHKNEKGPLEDYIWHWFILAGYEKKEDDLLVKAISYGEHKWFSLKEMWDTGYDKKGGMILYHI